MSAVVERLAPNEIVPSRGRRAWLAMLLVTGLTTACMSTTPESAATAPVGAVTDSGAPQPVAGLDWTYTVDGAEAKLAYGAPYSDDLRLGLECARGSGLVTVSRDAWPNEPDQFHLESGGETERIAAVAEASPTDGRFLTAELETTHPVLQRFRQTGWLAQWSGEDRQMMAPQAASRTKVEAFFAHCG